MINLKRLILLFLLVFVVLIVWKTFEIVDFSQKNCLLSPKKGEIVMLGNSITCRCNWNILLERDNIANLSVGGETTRDFIKRLHEIHESEAKSCFIMGGINDIIRFRKIEEINDNLITISKSLKQKKIKPYIFSILLTGEAWGKSRGDNKKIKKANKLIKQSCVIHDTPFIDLNKILSNDSCLNNQYTNDGVHLSREGYLEWSKVILQLIDNNYE